MAYFACAKAALTGTDKSTRASIAKGLVSPTFTDSSGQERLRGVVQLDVVTGRDTGYVTAKSAADRIRSALGYVPPNFAMREGRSRDSVKDETRAYVAELKPGDAGVIKTSTTLGLSNKAIMVGLAVVLGIYVVVSR